MLCCLQDWKHQPSKSVKARKFIFQTNGNLDVFRIARKTHVRYHEVSLSDGDVEFNCF